jgi:hypothetical protein
MLNCKNSLFQSQRAKFAVVLTVENQQWLFDLGGGPEVVLMSLLYSVTYVEL